MKMIDYRLDHIMTYTATLAPSEIIGPVPEGVRVNFYVTGGVISGGIVTVTSSGSRVGDRRD
jgi:hypothetical protein